MTKYSCVYCGYQQTTPFNEEHVVTRGLGRFLLEGRELVLTDKVCNECNQELDACDGELCYAGPESMFRLRAGIKGRKRKKPKASPFHKNRFSKQPAEMLGQRSERDFHDFWEIDPKTGQAVELRAITFEHPDTRERKAVAIDPSMTGAALRERLKEQGYPGGDHPCEVFCNDSDKPWLDKLLGKDASKMQWEDRRKFKSHEEINVTATFTITGKHHRGIAKIAFNYMMYFSPLGITGYEDSFEDIRNFIRYGKGHPNAFVRHTNKDVIADVGGGWALKDYGHIVSCSVGGRVLSNVHLFTGRESGHGTYQVLLGTYPFKIHRGTENVGHWFRIISDHKDSLDDGEVIPLFSPTKIVPVRATLRKRILS